MSSNLNTALNALLFDPRRGLFRRVAPIETSLIGLRRIAVVAFHLALQAFLCLEKCNFNKCDC
jgi:hypothetical protein